MLPIALCTSPRRLSRSTRRGLGQHWLSLRPPTEDLSSKRHFPATPASVRTDDPRIAALSLQGTQGSDDHIADADVHAFRVCRLSSGDAASQIGGDHC